MIFTDWLKTRLDTDGPIADLADDFHRRNCECSWCADHHQDGKRPMTVEEVRAELNFHSAADEVHEALKKAAKKYNAAMSSAASQ